MDVRILRESNHSGRDYLGFVEAPLQEIKLLRIWTEQVLDGAYSLTDEGFATLLMDLHVPNDERAREILIGRLRPGDNRLRRKRRNITLPSEHQRFS